MGKEEVRLLATAQERNCRREFNIQTLLDQHMICAQVAAEGAENMDGQGEGSSLEMFYWPRTSSLLV